MNNKPTDARAMTDREALVYLMGQFDAEIFVCPACSNEESTKEMDSAHFLRRHLDEVPAHMSPTVPKFKFDTLVEHCKRLESQLADERSRNNDLEFYRNDNAVWHWQNDGQDFLKSLVCPVIIPARQLRDLLQGDPHEEWRKDQAEVASLRATLDTARSLLWRFDHAVRNDCSRATYKPIAVEAKKFLDATVTACGKPPAGWACSRDKGHSGPCAASMTYPPVPADRKLPAHCPQPQAHPARCGCEDAQ